MNRKAFSIIPALVTVLLLSAVIVSAQGTGTNWDFQDGLSAWGVTGPVIWASEGSDAGGTSDPGSAFFNGLGNITTGFYHDGSGYLRVEWDYKYAGYVYTVEIANDSHSDSYTSACDHTLNEWVSCSTTFSGVPAGYYAVTWQNYNPTYTGQLDRVNIETVIPTTPTVTPTPSVTTTPTPGGSYFGWAPSELGLTGTWYTFENNEGWGAGSDFDFTVNTPDMWRLEGTVEQGEITGYEIRIGNNDTPDFAALGVDAISFEVSEKTQSPGTGGNATFTYPYEGSSITTLVYMVALNDAASTAEFTTDNYPEIDQFLFLPDWDQYGFKFKRFTYSPPPNTFALEISNIQLWRTDEPPDSECIVDEQPGRYNLIVNGGAELFGNFWEFYGDPVMQSIDDDPANDARHWYASGISQICQTIDLATVPIHDAYQLQFNWRATTLDGGSYPGEISVNWYTEGVTETVLITQTVPITAFTAYTTTTITTTGIISDSWGVLCANYSGGGLASGFTSAYFDDLSLTAQNAGVNVCVPEEPAATPTPTATPSVSPTPTQTPTPTPTPIPDDFPLPDDDTPGAGVQCWLCGRPSDWYAIGEWLAWLGCLIRNLFSCSLRIWFMNLWVIIQGLGDSILGFFSWIISTFGSWLSWLVTLAGGWYGYISSILSNLWSWLASAPTTLLTYLLQSEFIQTVWNYVSNIVAGSEALQILIAAVGEIISSLFGALIRFIEVLRDMFIAIRDAFGADPYTISLITDDGGEISEILPGQLYADGPNATKLLWAFLSAISVADAAVGIYDPYLPLLLWASIGTMAYGIVMWTMHHWRDILPI